MGRVFGIPVTPSDKSKGQWFFGGAIAISLLLHAIVWAALVDHAERQLPDTEETPIMVDLVPPPEQKTSEPQAQLEEPQSQPEEQQAQPEEQQAQPEEPPAQPEDQQKSEDQAAESPLALPTLQPVIEFAETDSGPRIDLDGTSERESIQPGPSEPEQAEEEQAEVEQVEAELGEPKQDEPVQDEPVQEEGEQAEPSTNEAEETQDADSGPPKILGDEAIETTNAEESSEQVPSELESPKQELVEQELLEQEPLEQEPPELEQSLPKPETNEVADTEAAPGGSDTEAPVVTLVTPKPRPARKRVAARRNTATAARRKTGNSGKLTRATRLFSREALADPRVRTAMRGIPRSDRVNMLCGTEMRGQLGAARPPRPPEFLPTFRLPRGTVLQPRQAAFRSRGQWFNFTFRCEVDKAATKVLKFSYRIGSRIPPADWARRGLPSF